MVVTFHQLTSVSEGVATIFMADQRIQLKNPVVAGVLAFLIPGAGHLYQGRVVKAAIFSICVLGLFCTGMAMAGWKAVQAPSGRGGWKRLSALKYVAQSGVGLPSLYALVQHKRYISPDNATVDFVDKPITAPFTGMVEIKTESGFEQGNVEGTISLNPAKGPFGAEIH